MSWPMSRQGQIGRVNALKPEIASKSSSSILLCRNRWKRSIRRASAASGSQQQHLVDVPVGAIHRRQPARVLAGQRLGAGAGMSAIVFRHWGPAGQHPQPIG
ncbi:MAG: hypothetical protein ABIX46_08825 [Burkholderiaceae bacterium]